ncbi:anthranilate synthase component II [Glycomyces paridis]|uniref:Aminodeoxychorismate/anthranilate synthase component II n=1 Tax=Glycomyces paridis TaxID=2126555 RepID=A0A4V4HNN9_9ACTN|nr:aminodeoxychorismate/anthranilate synthase component II [Glycomyces paridis]THV26516.1 aminodeoxychorismate/anthranilate synthase component II [Glycomyces paridis]
MKALLVDAYDSFAHIIYQYLRVLGVDTDVVRSGDVDPAAALAHDGDFVLLGPGPGTPEDSGHVELVRALAGVKPVLGVCLGHQAIGVAFGADVRPAKHLMHGKTSIVEHDGRGVFTGAPVPFHATRYHSLIVVEDTLPAELEVTARSADDGYVMGVRHRELPIEGVQFHPESILTEAGMGLFAAFAADARDLAEARR